ncbi:hypothetical protein GCM10020331_076370 [Ectobacillus funiculus]
MKLWKKKINCKTGGHLTLYIYFAVRMLVRDNGGHSEAGKKAKPIELLNVSYDPTRELYQEFNKEFAAYWKEKNRADRYSETITWRIGKSSSLGY